MKWVALVTFVCIAIYTYLTLHYRKPGPSHEPYRESVERAIAARLAAGGWQRIPADLERPVDLTGGGARRADVTRDSPGLGRDLAAVFVEKPPMLTVVDRASAPAEVTRGEHYAANFTGRLASSKSQLGDVALYRRGSLIVLIPTTEPLPGHALESRRPDNGYSVSFPTQSLPPGQYRARLVSQGPALEWSFTVR